MGKRKFPTTRPKVVVLANAMIHGLTVDTTDFPNPPVKSSDLQAQLDAALGVTNERTTAEAALRAIVEREADSYEALEEAMKTDLQYAEMMTKDDAKLQQLGWSGRAAPQPLQTPNAPRAFEILEQGKGSAHFDWKEPAGGGAVKMYRVLMMEVGGVSGSWKEVASAIDSEAVVSGQANGMEYLFCAVAVNAAGESGQSNAVTAYL